MRRRVWLAAPVMWMWAGAPNAEPSTQGVRNDIPSCRLAFFHEKIVDPQRDFIVVVDRTVTLGAPLARDTVDRIVRAIRPGDHIEVISFSGLSQAEFTVVQFDGYLDVAARQVELESNIPATQIQSATACFKNQTEYGRKKLGDRIGVLLAAPLSGAQRSEILRALTSISQQAIGKGHAHTKVVVIISDMLEFSDIASFYQKRRLRAIDTMQTLELAKAAQLIGSFDGAMVYVAGTALPSEAGQQAPGIRERRLLQDFWEAWFRESGATVVGLDNPALLHDIE